MNISHGYSRYKSQIYAESPVQIREKITVNPRENEKR